MSSVSEENLVHKLAVYSSALLNVTNNLEVMLQNCHDGNRFNNPKLLSDSLVRLKAIEDFLTRSATIEEEFRNDILLIRTKCPSLSEPEIRTAVFIRLGLKTHQISHLLCASSRTIETHRYNMRKKLGIESQYCLTRFLQEDLSGNCNSICIQKSDCKKRFFEHSKDKK